MNPALAICLGVGEACGHVVNEARRSAYVDILDGEVSMKVFDEGLVKVGEMSVLKDLVELLLMC